MREDPRLYFDLFGYQPHAGQWPVHDAWEKRFRNLACGVRFGKTTLCAAEIVSSMVSYKGSRGVFWAVAPTADLSMRVFTIVKDILFSKFHHRITDSRDRDRLLRIKNLGGGTSEVVGKTAESPESLLGEGVDGMVCDEFSRFKENIWQSYLLPRLFDKKGWALFPSTPNGKGLFYENFRKPANGETDWASFTAPSWSNPLISKEEIDAQYLGKVPERIYQQEFLAQFIEGGGSVFTNVDECCVLDSLRASPDSDNQYFMGVDIGRQHDYTVIIVVRQDGEMVYFRREGKKRFDVQEDLIAHEWKRWNCPVLMVDSTGLGDPVVESLERKGVVVNREPESEKAGFKFTNVSKINLMNHLTVMMENRQIKLPKRHLCPELIDELKEYEYEVSDMKNIKMSGRGKHDDCVIALSLACWPFRTRSWDLKLPQPKKKWTWGDEFEKERRRRKQAFRDFIHGRRSPGYSGAIKWK